MRYVAWVRGAIGLFGIFTLAASGEKPEKPELPIKGMLEYRLGRTLEEQGALHTRLTSIKGERCYKDKTDVQRDHLFVFDDKSDIVKIKVTDVNGVKPGQKFTYRLFFKNADGTIKGNNAFSLVTQNSFSAPAPVGIFDFVLGIENGNPDYEIEKGTTLGGFYELGATDRDIVVELFYELHTDIGYSSVCDSYN
ncbi:hypothetical protein [Rhizobium leguminosarum]|uniref:hypothetical protein n=1 Tax=Rhizobium leguminosarum TaxID=384 RepID=UPI0015FCAD00|nr:hypothetical protein [Rhizobium leguminosarum]MBA9030948.1 hypothetical protein [Rhizobium leguminosarum]